MNQTVKKPESSAVRILKKGISKHGIPKDIYIDKGYHSDGSSEKSSKNDLKM